MGMTIDLAMKSAIDEIRKVLEDGLSGSGLLGRNALFIYHHT